MTGLRSWNEYMIRSGEFVVFDDDALRRKNLLKRLQSVSYKTFREECVRWSCRLEETTKRRRFRRDPQKYLQEAESKYCALIGQS